MNDIWQVQLDRMLLRLHLRVHRVELAARDQLVSHGCVDRDVAERRSVRGAAGDVAGRRVPVMRGAEDEHAPRRAVNVLVRPCSRRARVRVARVRCNDRTRHAAAGVGLVEPATELRGELGATGRVPRAGERGGPLHARAASVGRDASSRGRSPPPEPRVPFSFRRQSRNQAGRTELRVSATLRANVPLGKSKLCYSMALEGRELAGELAQREFAVRVRSRRETRLPFIRPRQ